ncbi:hypothetical protein Tco_0727547 [Tanacetum coccineum]|uniref:Uncharacterized protein n=1 Tax=Tanacetum coccineum TaxID=301880 RepID=A0ABQ4YJP7_9ASTR
MNSIQAAIRKLVADSIAATLKICQHSQRCKGFMVTKKLVLCKEPMITNESLMIEGTPPAITTTTVTTTVTKLSTNSMNIKAKSVQDSCCHHLYRLRNKNILKNKRYTLPVYRCTLHQTRIALTMSDLQTRTFSKFIYANLNSGLPPVRQVEFQINLIPGATPVARHLTDKAQSEMRRTVKQLQE